MKLIQYKIDFEAKGINLYKAGEESNIIEIIFEQVKSQIRLHHEQDKGLDKITEEIKQNEEVEKKEIATNAVTSSVSLLLFSFFIILN